MTGDGVDDTPALEPTRHRRLHGVFGKIKKYLMYLLSANPGEILLLAGLATRQAAPAERRPDARRQRRHRRPARARALRRPPEPELTHRSAFTVVPVLERAKRIIRRRPTDETTRA